MSKRKGKQKRRRAERRQLKEAQAPLPTPKERFLARLEHERERRQLLAERLFRIRDDY